MLHNSESLPSDAAYWNSSNIPPKLRSPRVRQLKRTELAWRVGSAQCLRSPHKLKICGGPVKARRTRSDRSTVREIRTLRLPKGINYSTTWPKLL